MLTLSTLHVFTRWSPLKSGAVRKKGTELLADLLANQRPQIINHVRRQIRYAKIHFINLSHVDKMKTYWIYLCQGIKVSTLGLVNGGMFEVFKSSAFNGLLHSLREPTRGENSAFESTGDKFAFGAK